MMKSFFIIVVLCTVSYSQLLDYTLHKNMASLKNLKNIKILDTKELKFPKKNGIEFSELSGLAYKTNKLFAVSDRGYLYTFSLKIKEQKIDSLVMLEATKLKTKTGKNLKKKKRDAEGLAFLNDMLLISFERKQKVNLYDLNGVKIKKIKLNVALRNRNNYIDPNKGLESVTYNEKYGVISTPEEPLKHKIENLHSLYTQNESYSFKYKGSITGLEFIDEDRVLVLLREFHPFSQQKITTLLSVNLSQCRNTLCDVKTLAILDSLQGWEIDNFEGLTKVSKNKFLMVSDDNGSFFQKTLLVLFEIID